MRKFLIFLILLMVPSILFAEELVNLQYLLSEKKAEAAFDWDNTAITIGKNGIKAQLFLNYPYILTSNEAIKIDSSPFVKGGGIFVSQKTFEEVSDILDGKRTAKHYDIKERKIEKAEVEKKDEKKETVKKEAEKKEDRKEVEVKVVKEDMEKKEKKEDKSEVVGKRLDEPEIDYAASKPKNSGKKIIVLDPGHGGDDPGAIGANGTQEKDIVLGIALRARWYLLKEKNLDVYITRKDDRFISLKQRAKIANDKKADLFVSIHCNASPNKNAHGTRTYIYSRVASSKAAAASAKRENMRAGALEILMNDLRKGAYEYLSIESAGYIQHRLVKHLRLKWSPTERAPFYVLANTNMPSVLVESAFISNAREEKKLSDSDFRDKVARGVVEGILEYLEKIQ